MITHTESGTQPPTTTPPVDILDTFLDAVFPELDPDERLLLWASKKPSPAYPIDRAKFDRLNKGNDCACYFGTSTMHPDSSGDLRNRQSLFYSQYAVVVDDIGEGVGSKAPFSALPEGLRELAGFVIETSPGNHQLGYILEAPITDLAVARAFTSLFMAGAGGDTGGCLPNKLVRLPVGVNLKDKYINGTGTLFECRLVECSGKLVDCDTLLDCVNAGVTMADLVAGHAGKSRISTMGTTVHRDGVSYATLDGTVDRVLEWLNEKELIVSENAEWINIICPWAGDHESGDNTAGYSPAGYGELPDVRAFHCFHAHCNANRTPQFLD